MTNYGKPRKPDLVYRTPKWQRYQWKRFVESSPDATALAESGEDKAAHWSGYMRELFNRMYCEDPQQLDQVEPEHRWAQKAHQLAAEIPEFERLRGRCRGDRLWSGLAATSLAEEVIEVLPEDQLQEDTERLRRQIAGLEGLAEEGIPVDDELQAAQDRLQQAISNADSAADQMSPEMMRQAVRRACEKAQGQIDDATNAAQSFGWGLDEGGDGRGGNIEVKQQILAKLRNSAKLRRLAELAGRMRRLAAQKQRSKADHVRDEISNITIGDDIARMLPSEAIKLLRPKLKLLFYRQMLERSLLTYELKGTEEQTKGPIVVCVDNSGSMAGSNELWSKAVSLSLLDIARRQNRSFALLHFDSRVSLRIVHQRGPNHPDWQKVMEAMEHFSGGGTDFEPPLKEALQLIEHEGFSKADVILITDGCASDAFSAEYRRRAQAKEVTTYGVMIGGYGSETLQAYCDHVNAITDVTGGNEATDVLFEL